MLVILSGKNGPFARTCSIREIMFSFLCFVCFTICIFLISKQKRRNLPPSPAALPILGHLHLLKPAAHRVLRALSIKHGPVMHLYFGCIPVVVISSPSAVEECFVKNDVGFANRPQSVASKILGYNSTTIGFAPYGDHWRNLRRLTTVQIFSPASLQQTSVIRCRETRFLIWKMLQGGDEDWKKVNLRDLFFELVYNVATVMIAGRRGVVMDEMFGPSKILDVCDYIPLLRWIDVLGIKRKMEGLNKRRDGFLQGLIDEGRNKIVDSSSDDDEKKSYIERLLLMQQDEPECYTDEVLKGLILNMLTAGTHTVALTMEWAMSLLLNNPNELDKVRKEIDDNVATGEMVEESDLQKLPYLRCIINETLRLYPVGPILVPHCSSNDCNVGGFDIPRGTTLLVNAWAIQRDPDLWEDPDMFNPERFRGYEGGNIGFRFIPFGGGRRACPGSGMAMRLMGLALASFIHCFDWEREGRDLVDLEEVIGLTLSKANPLEAFYRPRIDHSSCSYLRLES